MARLDQGRHFKLCEMVRKCDSPLVLSFANKAGENVKERLVNKGVQIKEADAACHMQWTVTFANIVHDALTVT